MWNLFLPPWSFPSSLPWPAFSCFLFFLPSLWPSSIGPAPQAPPARRHCPLLAPGRSRYRRVSPPCSAVCRLGRFSFFLALAHRLFRSHNGPLAQSRRPPSQQSHAARYLEWLPPGLRLRFRLDSLFPPDHQCPAPSFFPP